VKKPNEFNTYIIYTNDTRFKKYSPAERQIGVTMELRDEAIEKIKERLSVIIGEGDYSEDTSFEALNIKSVNYSQLTTALEDEFDVEIPFMDFKRKATVKEAAEYIVQLVEG
jgi:acyl carrier protein